MNLKLENLKVKLSGKEILQEVTLEVSEGECLLIAGKSGAGKTTLLRAAVGVIPEKVSGEVSGKISPSPLKAFSFYITQEPWFSVITPYVWSEVLSFSSISWGEMLERLRSFKLSGKEYQSTYTLSSGELQRLSLIGALESGRKILLLDEPAAHLDEENKKKVIETVRELKSEGAIFLIVDHSLGDWKGVCDEVVVIEDGRVRKGSFDEYERVLRRYRELSPPDPLGEVICEVEISEFGYGDRTILKDLRFEVMKGEILWIKGPSGAGKSTLLRIIARGGVPGRAKVKRPRKTDYVPDNPLLYFSYPKPKYEARPEILEEFGVGHLGDSPIMRLSVGERRRVAVAAAVSRSSDLILLDEPTVGIDPYSKLPVLRSIVKAAEKGAAVIVASHDPSISYIANEVVEVGRSAL